MLEFKSWYEKRKKIQLVLALVFLFILIGGWFWPLLGYFLPLCMILGMGFGFFKGRVFCNLACPRGSFYDTLGKAISPRRKIPELFHKNSFRAGIMAFLMLVMISNLITRWPDSVKIGRFLTIMLTVTTFLGILLALLYHQRSWCSFCPVGSISAWLGGMKNTLKINSRLCTECLSCAKVCPVQIAPYKYKKQHAEIVTEIDCFKCNLCVLSCPTKSLSR